MATRTARSTSTPLSTRLLFGLLGALAALAAALIAEGVFARYKAPEYFGGRDVRALIFGRTPQAVTNQRLGTGDIQLTLSWNSVNDLDLHCIDPLGQTVWFRARSVPSGGRLDLDMNAGSGPWSTRAAENIFWPFNGAPLGTYKVYVHHFRRNGGPDTAPFKLRVLNKGTVENISSQVTYRADPGAPNDDARLDVPGRLDSRLLVSEFELKRPPQTTLGLTPGQWLAVSAVAAWSGLLGALLVPTLLVGVNHWYRRTFGEPRFSFGKIVGATLGALLLSAFGGALVQAGYGTSGGANSELEEMTRLVGWALLAAWLGLAGSRLIPHHLPSGAAVAGGALGGFAGCAAFVELLGAGAGAAGRLAGASIIGLAIGLQILLVVPGSGQAEEEAPWMQPTEAPAPPPPAPPPVEDTLIPSARDAANGHGDWGNNDFASLRRGLGASPESNGRDRGEVQKSQLRQRSRNVRRTRR